MLRTICTKIENVKKNPKRPSVCVEKLISASTLPLPLFCSSGCVSLLANDHVEFWTSPCGPLAPPPPGEEPGRRRASAHQSSSSVFCFLVSTSWRQAQVRDARAARPAPAGAQLHLVFVVFVVLGGSLYSTFHVILVVLLLLLACTPTSGYPSGPEPGVHLLPPLTLPVVFVLVILLFVQFLLFLVANFWLAVLVVVLQQRG